MKIRALFLLFLSLGLVLSAQVTLNADGPGNTYELITSVLAPGENPIESPGHMSGSCDNHVAFGRHITEVFDNDLNDDAFKFILHVSEDNDRCRNFDRQRNEIKSYSQSPDNLLGVTGETVLYTWKFKLDADFQASKGFTHLHQLKAVGGTQDAMPLITLTARKASPDRLELRYAETTSQITLTTIDLSLLKGQWIEATETVLYGENGTYAITLKNVATGVEILNYSNMNIRMWKTMADFVRPKWGIYRSLSTPSDLRDEEVLFANFLIAENPTLSTPEFYDKVVSIYPNPTTGMLKLDFLKNRAHYTVTISDISGKQIMHIDTLTDPNTLDFTDLSNGIYFAAFISETRGGGFVKRIVKQ